MRVQFDEVEEIRFDWASEEGETEIEVACLMADDLRTADTQILYIPKGLRLGAKGHCTTIGEWLYLTRRCIKCAADQSDEVLRFEKCLRCLEREQIAEDLVEMAPTEEIELEDPPFGIEEFIYKAPQPLVFKDAAFLVSDGAGCKPVGTPAETWTVRAEPGDTRAEVTASVSVWLKSAYGQYLPSAPTEAQSLVEEYNEAVAQAKDEEPRRLFPRLYRKCKECANPFSILAPSDRRMCSRCIHKRLEASQG